MALPAIALGISAGLGALKFGAGRRQRRRARRIRERAQREFESQPFQTPTEALQALQSAQTVAGQTQLPGQTLLEQQMLGATGSALQATREAAVTPQDISAGATQAYQNLYVNPLLNLGVSAAQRYDVNQQNLQAQLNNISQYRTKEWEQNVLLPYQMAMQTAGQLAAAGQQNQFSGISDVAGGLANFALAGLGTQRAATNQVANMQGANLNSQYIDSPLQLPGFTPRLPNNSVLTNDNLIQYYG